MFQRILEWLSSLLTVLLSYLRPRVEAMRMGAPYRGDFVRDYALSYPDSTPEQRQEIMGYYPLDSLPALHTFGRAFTVCNHWYSSVPGPTWANRFFVHTGTALGRVWMPEKKEDLPHMRPYDQPTLYDRLNEQKVSWRVYFGDIPQSAYFERVKEVMKDKYRLSEKFGLLVSDLAPDDSSADAAIFTDAKKKRDKLSHGEDVPEETMPIEQVRGFLRKYLKLHLERASRDVLRA